ncbi:MAG: hypothetical protein AcusKO_19560 [Acuticoccus sp.]
MDVVEPSTLAAITERATAAGDAATVGTASQNTLDYDAFLRLLVEQMKNQDPLEPTSETEYVAQLATFSNVEQNIITNERLMSLITTNTLTDAQALIGRTITSPDGESGTVESVKVASGAISATLSDGRTVTVGDGVTVS